MKRKAVLALVITLSLMMSLAVSSFASESTAGSKHETNFLEEGFVVIDADGKIVPQPRFTIDSNVLVPAGGTLYSKADCWYNGDLMTFTVTLDYGDCEYLDVVIWSPRSYACNIGPFSRISGSKYYGRLDSYLDHQWLIDPGKYYNYGLYNNLDGEMKVRSFTGVNFY